MFVLLFELECKASLCQYLIQFGGTINTHRRITFLVNLAFSADLFSNYWNLMYDQMLLMALIFVIAFQDRLFLNNVIIFHVG